MGPRACGSKSPVRKQISSTETESRVTASTRDGSTMSTMLTLTLQLALATTAVAPASAGSVGALHPALVEQVQGWRGSPTTPPPAPPPPPPQPVAGTPRGAVSVHPTQAPPPPVVERWSPRRGWV